MTADQKKRCFQYAAWPLSLLVCGGLYFGARTLSDAQFASAVESASEQEVQYTEGLSCCNLLTAREQQLYRILREAMAAREETTARVAFVPTQEEFTAAFDAVLCDCPVYCDLVREECTLLAAEHSAQVSLSYLPDGEVRRQTLEETVRALMSAVSGQSPADAALLAHDTLTDVCTYPSATGDEQVTGGSTAYDALVTGEANGLGYALAYTLLCRSAGIDCAVVRGEADAGDRRGAHAWNVLTLDGETGFTDVMWDDTAAMADGGTEAASLPFHGYYFLSAEEMAADHTPISDFGGSDETQNYYERNGVCADSAERLETLFVSLLTEARRSTSDTVEFWLDPQLNLTGYALEEIFSAAITAANADETITAPPLRAVNRVYHTSASGGGITVQLFYEENEDLLGET